jgi:putative tricarboxylic transport membrane protein
MLDTLAHLGPGFIEVFQPINLMVLIIGLVLGLLVAVLPGLTLVMGVVLVLPFTYTMGLVPAIILLTAMYVSGTYGGAFTAILFRIPGEPIDVPLLWDGYTMARKGHPAKALGWTLFAALGGGLLSAAVMVLLSQPVAKFALTLSSPDYFAIILFGLTSVVALGGGSITNAVISLCIGLLIATVGIDSTYGSERFTFGLSFLNDGIEYLLVMVGAYGIGEVFTRFEKGFRSESVEGDGGAEFKTELPTLREVGQVKSTFFRSSILGIIVGMVPGAGATIASFVAYGAESQYGKRRKELGKGIPEGIIAPQTAATSSVGGALIPLLTMGIPGSGATAIILGAFLLHGMQPGPQIFVSSSHIIYPIFASLFVSIIGMCILGYFAIKLLVKVLHFPEAVVSAFVVMFCFIGALAARNNLPDLYMITAFGILGYLFERFKFPIAPLVLGCILGPLAETSFMTMMVSENNNWLVLFTRPVSATVMVFSIIAVVYPIVRQVSAYRGVNRVKAARS